MKVTQESTYHMCPKFAKTFGILGKKWNGLIIDVLLAEGPQRFKDIASKVDKCSDRVMVERLKELEGEGLVEKIPSEGCCRESYQLTKQGQDLAEVMGAVHAWANKWYSLEDCK